MDGFVYGGLLAMTVEDFQDKASRRAYARGSSPGKGWPGGGALARLAETLNDLNRRPGVRMGSR
jgi:hypothetical protein